MSRNDDISPKEARLRQICNAVKNGFRKAIEDRSPVEIGIIQAVLDNEGFDWKQIVEHAIKDAEKDHAHSEDGVQETESSYGP